MTFSSSAYLPLSVLVFLLFVSKLASADVLQTDRGYEVPGVGIFNYKFSVDFSKVSTLPPDLRISRTIIAAGSAPYSRSFHESNVRLNANDSLSLLVPGQPSFVDDIPSAEITTNFSDILHASVRTVIKASNASGTCHGLFFYHNDYQEADAEILTRNLSRLWFTNQANNDSVSATALFVRAPVSISLQYHEIRLDWLSDRTDFYLDGVKQATLKQNVPSVPGAWIWNNWANGGSWTGPPPTMTSDMRIKSITAFFNRTSLKYEAGSTASSRSTTTSLVKRLSTNTLPTQRYTQKPPVTSAKSPPSTSKTTARRTTTATHKCNDISTRRSSTRLSTVRSTLRTSKSLTTTIKPNTKPANKAKSTSKTSTKLAAKTTSRHASQVPTVKVRPSTTSRR